MLRRLVVSVLAAVVVSLSVVSLAQAQTVSCTPFRYSTDDTGIPYVSHLRATNLPRLTSGYAPRCLVADSALSRLRNYNPPKRIRLRGARWDAGRWTVSTRFDRNNFFTLVRVVRGSMSITFRLSEPRD